MVSKLTLKIDKQTIQIAKLYAKSKKTSLSKLVENYLILVSDPKKEDNELTPMVRSLSGILKVAGKKPYKELYKTHLKVKYGK